jgi:hypothetical protein
MRCGGGPKTEPRAFRIITTKMGDEGMSVEKHGKRIASA